MSLRGIPPGPDSRTPGERYPLTIEEIEGTRVPDAFAPVVGFRRFAIPWPPVGKYNDLLVQRGHRWTPDGPTVAECRRPGAAPPSHAAPAQECSCGLYAWLEIREALGYHDITSLMGWALASVIGWGRVLFDEDFWRAEKALVVALADPYDTHADKPGIVRERTGKWVERVANTYGVPVLPSDELHEHSLSYGEEYEEAVG